MGANKPPVAIAKPDTIIILPCDSVLLNGEASYDPDGTISNYHWRNLSGPANFNIATAALKKTMVRSLVTGSYQFELAVTDNGGLVSRDTITITVDATPTVSHPPVAHAGPDQSITLPTSSVAVDGSGSTDPDNNITTYLWTTLSGPSGFNILNPNAVQTQINQMLSPGVYVVVLTVTDATNLSSRDTMQITVNPQAPITVCDNSNRPQVPAQLIPVATLSQARFSISVISAGNKIFFAGGATNGPNGNFVPTSRVDIWDLTSNTWTTAELCIGRYMIGCAVAGNKLFFAGGEVGDGTWPVDSVDIYDISTNSWSVMHLSVAGHEVAATSVGNKVLFAGGDEGLNANSNLLRAKTVDIYDLNTNTWSTSQLSQWKRGGQCAVTANNKVYIAGGETWVFSPGGNYWYPSDTIDIYDNATNTWSTRSMIEGKVYLSGIFFNNKIYWAGGFTGINTTYHESCLVEEMNINGSASTANYLYKPAQFDNDQGTNAVVSGSKIVYLRPYEDDRDKFDIYDVATNTWSIGILPQLIPAGASVICVNGIIYVAGGVLNGVNTNQVYKLQF